MPAQNQPTSSPPQPFQIAVSADVLNDLQQRLARTRWPGEVEGAGFDDGVSQDFMQKLVTYWQNGYEWRAAEQKLNSLAQFQLVVDGLNLHFIHEHGNGKPPAHSVAARLGRLLSRHEQTGAAVD